MYLNKYQKPIKKYKECKKDQKNKMGIAQLAFSINSN